jgi:hypothetical protein
VSWTIYLGEKFSARLLPETGFDSDLIDDPFFRDDNINMLIMGFHGNLGNDLTFVG